LVAVLAQAASAAPPGITMKAGNLADADGRQLYVYQQDAGGQPACTAECAAASRPFLAPGDARPEGLWTIVKTPAGEQQWAYDGKLLHTRILPPAEPDPWAGIVQPARIKDVIGEGFAFVYPDRSLATRPMAGRNFAGWLVESYPLASIQAGEQGVVRVSTCVDKYGAAFDTEVLVSSGFKRLDDATVQNLPRAQFRPSRDTTGKPVAICGHQLDVEWALHP
jgi:TonB family protein